MLRELLARRLVIVTGKGGVGKSTIATALALLASRQKRTLLVELEAQRSIARFFGKPPAGYEAAEVAPNLSLINITGLEAIRDYLQLIVPVGLLVEKITAHPLYRYFTEAAPGIKELLTFGKIWKLEDEKHRHRPLYDLIVVDGFPTGQALNMFRSPIEVCETLKVGPIASKARHLVDLMRDAEKTAFLLATLPEEMPVAESIDLYHALTRDIRIAYAGIAVNAILPKRFRRENLGRGGEIERAVGEAFREIGAGDSHVVHAYRAAHEEMRWRLTHEHYLKRLASDLPGPFLHLPFVFKSDGGGELVERIAAVMAGEIAEPLRAAR